MNAHRPCRRRAFAATLLAGCAGIGAAATGGWRRLTPAEEQFVQTVEAQVYAMLRTAVARLPGRWETRIETAKFQRHELDEGQHHNRPHEVRIDLYAQWQPTDEELAVVDREIDLHAQEAARHDPVPDHLNRRDPSHRLALHAQVIVNPYGYQPTLVSAAGALGELTRVPGTVFSYLRWRQMGTGAPKRILYLGELVRRPGSGGERVFETFGDTRECRNVRTVIIEIDSAESLSQAFVTGLDIARLNALVRDL